MNHIAGKKSSIMIELQNTFFDKLVFEAKSPVPKAFSAQKSKRLS